MFNKPAITLVLGQKIEFESKLPLEVCIHKLQVELNPTYSKYRHLWQKEPLEFPKYIKVLFGEARFHKTFVIVKRTQNACKFRLTLGFGLGGAGIEGVLRMTKRGHTVLTGKTCVSAFTNIELLIFVAFFLIFTCAIALQNATGIILISGCAIAFKAYHYTYTNSRLIKIVLLELDECLTSLPHQQA